MSVPVSQIGLKLFVRSVERNVLALQIAEENEQLLVGAADPVKARHHDALDMVLHSAGTQVGQPRPIEPHKNLQVPPFSSKTL